MKIANRKKILIADSNAHEAQKLWDVLHQHKYATVASLNADAIMALCGDNSIDLAIIAKSIIIEEGFVKKLKEKCPNIKIMLSLKEGEELEESLYVDGVITKPYEPLKKRGLKRMYKPIEKVLAG